MTKDELNELICDADEYVSKLGEYIRQYRDEKEDSVLKDASLEALVGELCRRGYNVEYLLDEQ